MNLIKRYITTKKLVKKSKEDLNKMYIEQEEKMKTLIKELDKHGE